MFESSFLPVAFCGMVAYLAAMFEVSDARGNVSFEAVVQKKTSTWCRQHVSGILYRKGFKDVLQHVHHFRACELGVSTGGCF